MITEANRNRTCCKCGGHIAKGETITLTSGDRASHHYGCPEREVPQTVRTTVRLDSYEQECEAEGIPMGYRSY